ncbi:MAG: glutathione peroxidase [Litoreibacter sp.]|nr:glutathione peroxidase [Litoreibacter sp.]
MFRTLIAACIGLAGSAGLALSFTFENIDGGEIDLTEYRGQPVLVVNTASLCGFTQQYEGLQQLYDTYRNAGLVVLAVPSDDFRQELGTESEVKEFCALNYELDLPMTGITDVKGRDAHPFYAWVRKEEGFIPGWNFNKILLGPDGFVVETYGSTTKPMSKRIRREVEALLDAG